ncbi:MAG: transcriptional repressor [Clostridia bacterium]|nr:transcriptional repressor [Clostridia bacterium]
MKYSKQREKIQEYLKSVKTHPTANQIYSELIKEIPNLSLGTVYRNLDNLYTQGLIKKVRTYDDTDRFDGDLSMHYHVVCACCGKIEDGFDEYFDNISKKLEQNLDCKILSDNLIFNVLCSKCKDNLRRK